MLPFHLWWLCCPACHWVALFQCRVLLHKNTCLEKAGGLKRAGRWGGWRNVEDCHEGHSQPHQAICSHMPHACHQHEPLISNVYICVEGGTNVMSRSRLTAHRLPPSAVAHRRRLTMLKRRGKKGGCKQASKHIMKAAKEGRGGEGATWSSSSSPSPGSTRNPEDQVEEGMGKRHTMLRVRQHGAQNAPNVVAAHKNGMPRPMPCRKTAAPARAPQCHTRTE